MTDRPADKDREADRGVPAPQRARVCLIWSASCTESLAASTRPAVASAARCPEDGSPLFARSKTNVPMHTNALPEIAASDLKAAREFLTGARSEGREARTPRTTPAPCAVPVRNGIARARMRSAAKPDA